MFNPVFGGNIVLHNFGILFVERRKGEWRSGEFNIVEIAPENGLIAVHGQMDWKKGLWGPFASGIIVFP
jgi:hypothetical protein